MPIFKALSLGLFLFLGIVFFLFGTLHVFFHLLDDGGSFEGLRILNWIMLLIGAIITFFSMEGLISLEQAKV